MTQKHTPDRIWSTGNSTTGSWNASEVNPRIAPHQNKYLLSTPVREAAPELLEAASALIDDVRARHPNEELRCEYMRNLDAAIAKAKGATQ